MAKFNKPISQEEREILDNPHLTVNYEGGIAFGLVPKVRLFTRVLTTLLGEDKFYQSASSHDKDIFTDIHAVAETDPEFILQLAVFARNYMNLRTVPMVLLAECSLMPVTQPFVRRYAPFILKRADELLEVVAYIKHTYFEGKLSKIPACLKKGIEKSLENFDEYQLLKYEPTKGIKMKDIIRLCHPKPGDKARDLLYGILMGKKEPDRELTPIAWALQELDKKKELDFETLELARMAHATHELIIKKYGSTEDTWKAILPTMGYMAKLRNLFQLAEVLPVEDVITLAEDLKNEKGVLSSKQFPFRFYSAYKALEEKAITHKIENYRILKKAVATALDISIKNIPKISGRTLIAVDVSGSMESPLSKYSTVSYKNVSLLLGAMANTIFDSAVTYLFGENIWRGVLEENLIMNNYNNLNGIDVGHSTNAYKIIKDIIQRKDKYDRIILLSDMQCYQTAENPVVNSLAYQMNQYRQRINPHTVFYSIDLAGYGTSQFSPDDKKLCLMAGWSEKIFQFISLHEKDGAEMVNFITSWVQKRMKDKTAENKNPHEE